MNRLRSWRHWINPNWRDWKAPVLFGGIWLAALPWLGETTHAADPPPGLTGLALADGGAARIVLIIDGDTVRLADGREVRLVGIQAPKLPLDRPGFVKWPRADEAKTLLSELALGQEVKLRYGGARQDRYGRMLAHLYAGSAIWLQGEMVERGLARVYSFADNRALVSDLLAREKMARAARRGLWADPYYAIADAAHATDQIGRYALVEGRVLKAEMVAGRIFLNFGADIRSDFTVTVAPEDRALFERGRPLAAYAGRRVRVRGWVESRNGPQIEATHAEQIELLDE